MITIEQKYLIPAINYAKDILGDACKCVEVKDETVDDLKFYLAMMTDNDKHDWQIKMSAAMQKIDAENRLIEELRDWDRVEAILKDNKYTVPFIQSKEHMRWVVWTDLKKCGELIKNPNLSIEEKTFYADMINELRCEIKDYMWYFLYET